jgi:hypothetical protein
LRFRGQTKIISLAPEVIWNDLKKRNEG